MIAYQVVIYRDTDLDAAVDQRVLEDVYDTPEQAIEEARHAFDGEWRSATVHEGEWRQRKFNGRVRFWFEDGDRVRWYVGPDYADREETA